MIDKATVAFWSSTIFTFFFVFGFLMIRRRDESRPVTKDSVAEEGGEEEDGEGFNN